MDWRQKIRTIPDFPKKSILFYDITPVLQDAVALRKVASEMVARYQNQKIDAVIGIESRGFIFGALLAEKLGVGFVPIRKQGKLPHKTMKQAYELEYGEAIIEIHKDAIQPNANVLIVDDLLATGGTARAAAFLVEKLNAKIVELCFLIELTALKGRNNLKGYKVHSLVQFDG